MSIPTMTKGEALQKDRKGRLYADWYDETNDYAIFGTESGFCYQNGFGTEGEADKKAEELEKEWGIGAKV